MELIMKFGSLLGHVELPELKYFSNLSEWPNHLNYFVFQE